jgi:hypothetical protein
MEAPAGAGRATGQRLKFIAARSKSIYILAMTSAYILSLLIAASLLLARLLLRPARAHS